MQIARKKSILQLIRRKGFKQFLTLCITYKYLYITVILLQLGVTAASLLFAETNRRLFDLAPDIPGKELSKLLTAFFVFIAMGLVFSLMERVYNQIVNTNVVFRMREMVLTRLTSLSLRFHEDKHSSHSNNILYNELEVFKHFVVFDILKLISLPISFISVGIYLLSVNPVLGIIAIMVGPLQFISNLVIKERFKNLVTRQQELGREWFFHLGETLSGMREIKMNRIEHTVFQRINKVFKESIALWISIEKMWAVRETVRIIPEKLGYMIGIGVGAFMMADGKIGVGGLVAFITLLDRAAAPFNSIVEIINSLQRVSAGAEKLLDLMETEPEDDGRGITLLPSPPSITFENVNFHYYEDHQVLKNVHFTIPAGWAVALVGPSGSGKSTIIKLLFRFYHPQSGTIRINGLPIEAYTIDSLRGNLAAVSQDVYLFDGTIRDNIAIGSGNAGDEEIIRAAILSQSDEFINRLPERYETKVGERGIKLSQGQKQRIAIARAIMRKASVVILDEPTSALDVETETLFQRNLGEWADGCTKIIIAHRLSTIRDADYVLFLENGEIREAGTPRELLNSNGRFKDFWNKQEIKSFS
ncbi:ABC transporter ATP-binding protein/permease [Paenibacillus sp. sptzw28]|uniref:ABC transporter ATP-binding protein n=1 Tax=Paenibacillus sp. sptzw28 TaxID=715179 RepID=UPI001C6DF2F0|nr:ABC transporter ATP-binding protein [Paenibacillus sp. sptzw28]QYR19671.1 ABC transporter ATP-binding protein/permease [Paenibacillus sp. sptzw28]